MRPLDQDHQDGESYEFSFRHGYGPRLFVHVPKASLDILRRGSDRLDSPLRLLLEHNAAMCALAITRSQEEQTTRVVLTESDAESILADARPADSSKRLPAALLNFVVAADDRTLMRPKKG